MQHSRSGSRDRPTDNSASSSRSASHTSQTGPTFYPGFLSRDPPSRTGPDPSLETPLSPPSPDSGSGSPGSYLPYLRQASPITVTSPRPSSPPPSEPTTARPARADPAAPVPVGRDGETTRASPMKHATGAASPSTASSSTSAPSSAKKRPSPLDLKGHHHHAATGGEKHQELDGDAPESGRSLASVGSNMSEKMADLSLLRRNLLQNLRARPLSEPLDSDSGSSSGMNTPQTSSSPGPARLPSFQASIHPEDLVSVVDVLDMRKPLIVDTRPLGPYLEAHLAGSANISIPSLMLKRLRKATAKGTTWQALGAFISTPAGKVAWDRVDPEAPVTIAVLGHSDSDLPVIVKGILDGVLRNGRVKIVQGGWEAVERHPVENVKKRVVSGEPKEPNADIDGQEVLLPPPRTAPAFDIPPPPIPDSSLAPPRVAHHPSMPSLRNERPFPAHGPVGFGASSSTASSTRRTPKLSLNLQQPLRSATLPPEGGMSGLLSARSSSSNLGRRSPGLSISVPKSPSQFLSVQHLCASQAKLPPSPSSFGDVKRFSTSPDDEDPTEDLLSPGQTARLPRSASSISSESGWPSPYSNTSTAAPSPQTLATAIATPRNGIAPFVVTTILPAFLYLGPEIASQRDIDELKRIGVRRVLNVALECEDEDGLGLRNSFEKYHKVPMRDIVEETNVARSLREACNYLDDARLHSAPTYVHCKAGKSRSVTVVLAYLIHANAWTLKVAYAYVAERRKGISPNIGFVAELMQFEESELGIRQSGGVHGDSGARQGGTTASGKGANSAAGAEEDSPRNARMRESMPPAWSSSLDSGSRSPMPLVDLPGEGDKAKEEREGRKAGEEREVRKNGQWVHQRRAPVDRTTLQPGRRVSKAGLESLRPLAAANASSTDSSPRPSPTPSPGLGEKGLGVGGTMTPSTDGRLNWV